MQNKKELRSQMFAMITQWQEGGLKQRTFCNANKIAYHVFHYWYGVYRSENSGTNSFIPLSISSTTKQELITITAENGIQVQVPFTNQSVGFIRQLLLS